MPSRRCRTWRDRVAIITRAATLDNARMASHTVNTVIAAPRDVVFGVFADRERNGEFLPISTRLVTPGASERQGVGAVHFLGVGPVGIHEQSTDLRLRANGSSTRSSPAPRCAATSGRSRSRTRREVHGSCTRWTRARCSPYPVRCWPSRSRGDQRDGVGGAQGGREAGRTRPRVGHDVRGTGVTNDFPLPRPRCPAPDGRSSTPVRVRPCVIVRRPRSGRPKRAASEVPLPPSSS